MDHESYPYDIWAVVLFDVLASAFLMWLLALPSPSGSHAPGKYDFYYYLVGNLTRLLFLVTPIFLLMAVFFLLRRPLQNRRRAAFCQRFAFWGLLLIVAVNFLSGYLPTEGGVGGFLLMIFLGIFIVLTLIAFGCARRVAGLSSRETAEETHE